MSVLTRLFRGGTEPEQRGLYQDAFLSDDLPRSSMSSAEALRLSAVWRCESLIAETVAGLPFHSFRRGSLEAVAPTPDMIDRPSDQLDGVAWRAAALRALLRHGNAFGYITTDGAGRPVGVELLPNDKVATDETGGRLAVRVGGEVIPPDRLFHMTAYNVAGSALGLSPIAYAARALSVGTGAAKMADDWYRGGGHPTSLLTTESAIDQDQATTAKERFKAATKADHLAVLGNGWEYEAIQAKPADAMFLEAIRATDIDVCRFYGVPPEMIGAAVPGSSLTYANREQRAIDFVTFSVAQWVGRLERAITELLPPAQYAKGNVDGLLRADAMTRARVIDMQLRNGTLSQNEGRALDERTAIDDGDEYVWPPGSTDDGDDGLSVAEVVQKVYLGVGKVITADEAREIVNAAGGSLDLPGPDLGDIDV